MFSLATLPVHCCNTVFTDVTSLTSSTLVTLLAMLRDRDTEALCSAERTAVLQQNVLEKSLDKQTICSNTVLLFVELNTTMALAILTNNVILSVQVLVKAVGVKLLKVFSTEIMVFSVTPCSSADTA